MYNQVPPARSADIIPITKIFISLAYILGSTIPLRIVDVTSPPAKKAPKNSKIAAIIMACFMVIALLPTEVPIEFATSLAPIPKAIKNPIKPAIKRMVKGSRNKFSIF